MALRRGSYWIKLALIAAGAAVADLAFWRREGAPGANVGVLALTWVAALAVASPAVRRDRLARTALLVATAFAVLQFERPTFVGLALYVVAMGVAALAPRAPRGEDAWRWAQRLVAGAVVPVVGPLLDLAKLRRARRRGPVVRIGSALAVAALPLLGGAVFVSLFAAANPVISSLFGGWDLMWPDSGRYVFWAVMAFPLWVVLRPRGLRRTLATPGRDRDLGGAWAGPTAIAASLALFNLIFAVQNGLDIAYLWSGAGLPEGVSFADYAHRGAYPLIATALLAGLFVLVFLRPGSATATTRPIRILVTAWVAQNVFLVASTALRTLDYIEAYSLTRMRIAALLWMALVATGLLLILWRLLRGRTPSWLINANVAAAGLVLATCSVVDLGAIAAAWNVRHAREVGGRGVALDTCYLEQLGGASLVALAELERRPLPPTTHAKVVVTRNLVLARMESSQATWRGWRYRDARRIERMRAILGGRGQPFPQNVEPRCDAKPLTPPVGTPSLTPAANPRT